MRAVREIWAELLERRLWPVALLLVAALVAVPLVLAKSPSDVEGEATATTPLATAAAADVRTDDPVVTLAPEDDDKAPLRGKAKNPFKQQHGKASDTDVVPVVVVPVPTGPGTGSVDGGSGGTGTGTGGTGGTGEPPRTFVRASIDVRFGKAGGQLRALTDVPRLTPLPNADTPIVIFLGMRRDHETAVFLVSTDVHAQGEGRCVPSTKLCEAIELRRGQIAFLDFSDENGRVSQYELDLVDVVLHETTSEEEARSSWARVSRAGARLLRRRARTSANTTGRPFRMPFRYIERSGVLHIAPYASQRARGARVRGAISGGRVVDATPTP